MAPAPRSSNDVDPSKHAWPDTEALVAIVGLATALSVSIAGVAAIAGGRVIDDTRPTVDAAAGTTDVTEDDVTWPYVFGA